MAIRMTGLFSNMDTESVVQQLMKGHNLKKQKIENKKTKLEWQKDIWADLNKKLYSLYTDYASKMRLQGSYKTKSSTVSDETKVGVSASSSAVNGTYSLKINQTAAAQYITGAAISGTNIKDTTLLSAIDPTLVGKEITIKNGTKETYLQVKSTTKISDFVNTLKAAGLNASYDATNKRLFIGGSNSGVANTFSITTTQLNANEISARDTLTSLVNYDSLTAAQKTTVDTNIHDMDSMSATMKQTQALLDTMQETDPQYIETKALYDDAKKKYDEAVSSLQTIAYTNNTQARAHLKSQLVNENYNNIPKEVQDLYYDDFSNKTIKSSVYRSWEEKWNTLTAQDKEKFSSKEDYIQKSVKNTYETTLNNRLETAINANTTNLKTRLTDIINNGVSSLADFSQSTIDDFGLKTFSGLMNASQAYYNIDSASRSQSATVDTLKSLGISDVSFDSSGNILVGGTGIADGSVSNSSMPAGMAVIAAKDSVIELNGAILTGSSNTMTVNGLTLNLKNVTSQAINLTVSNDVDSVYKSVKDFISQYNAVLKEMNTSYYAATAKGYEPLSDDEKEAMTDSQIELWEGRIKSSLLRNDTKLGSIISSMKAAMQTSVTVNGVSRTLASYGITTSSDYSEKGLLHIFGDKEDSTYADKEDKLKKALEEDPESVMKVISEVASSLYTNMQDKMKSTTLKSALTFYNDKQIKKQIENYEDELDKWDKKLQTIEDKYYKQFAAMEKAMASLNSQQSTLAGFLGNK